MSFSLITVRKKKIEKEKSDFDEIDTENSFK